MKVNVEKLRKKYNPVERGEFDDMLCEYEYFGRLIKEVDIKIVYLSDKVSQLEITADDISGLNPERVTIARATLPVMVNKMRQKENHRAMLIKSQAYKAAQINAYIENLTAMPQDAA